MFLFRNRKNLKSVLYLIYFLLFSSYGNSQDYNFAIGLTYQPYFYQNYNKSDWNNRPETYPEKGANFNGKAFGIVLIKPLSDYFSIKTELTYSIQSQKNIMFSNSRYESDNQSLIYYYGKYSVTDFKIIKLPVLSSFAFEIGSESGLYINGYLGIQISFLTNYTSTFIHYGFDEIKIQVDKNILINNIIRTPRHFSQIVFDGTLNPPDFKYYEGETPYIYNRWLIGALGGFEFQKKISAHILLGMGVRLDYDFTNSEKHPEALNPEMAGVGKNGPRSKSHNMRYGFSFSTLYLFE